MATNFPTGVDTFTNPVSNDSLNSPSHSVQHADANDAIEAIENAIIDPANYPNQLVNKTTATVRPLPFASNQGTASIVFGGAGTGTVSVTFAASRFTQAPWVYVQTTSANAQTTAAANSITTSGFTILGYSTAAATRNFSWFAVQMTSAAANG